MDITLGATDSHWGYSLVFLEKITLSVVKEMDGVRSVKAGIYVEGILSSICCMVRTS